MHITAAAVAVAEQSFANSETHHHPPTRLLAHLGIAAAVAVRVLLVHCVHYRVCGVCVMCALCLRSLIR